MNTNRTLAQKQQTFKESGWVLKGRVTRSLFSLPVLDFGENDGWKERNAGWELVHGGLATKWGWGFAVSMECEKMAKAAGLLV